MAISIVFCSILPAFAYEENADNREYSATVAEIMKNYRSDPVAAEKALKEIDTELVGEPVTTQHSFSNSSSNARGIGTDPTDYEFTVYCFKRGNSRVHYLQFYIEALETEWAEGPLDYCSIEWDTAYGKYYSSYGDDIISTVQARDTGIVLFNIQDEDLKKGEYTIGTVEVSPIKSGDLEYGSKFVHTYTSLLVSGSASYNMVSSASVDTLPKASLGLSHTKTYTVNVSSKTNQWQLWTDNAVTLSV